MLIPKRGSLERIVLGKLQEQEGAGVTHLDFIGTSVTEENLPGIIENLKTGMFEAENDGAMKVDG
jgi:hypothetical protein